MEGESFLPTGRSAVLVRIWCPLVPNVVIFYVQRKKKMTCLKVMKRNWNILEFFQLQIWLGEGLKQKVSSSFLSKPTVRIQVNTRDRLLSADGIFYIHFLLFQTAVRAGVRTRSTFSAASQHWRHPIHYWWAANEVWKWGLWGYFQKQITQPHNSKMVI